MQRENKFRGKNIVTGEWVYGSLVNNLWKYSESHSLFGQSVCEIITGEYEGDCWEDIASQDEKCIVTVIPETVGQYTTFNVKDEELYDGDLIINTSRNGGLPHPIKWSEIKGAWVGDYGIEYLIAEELIEITKVGTIHDNPELLTQ